MTPIDWKLFRRLSNIQLFETCHHSLVTPIDWKPAAYAAWEGTASHAGHHSLVTPIDWKLDKQGRVGLHPKRHHSLVTPIDWKPSKMTESLTEKLMSHHSLVTPIDWKLEVFLTLFPRNLGHHSLVTPIDWKQQNRPKWRHGVIGRSPLAGDTY